MAFSIIQKSAAVATGSGSVTATLPAGSTAGNLLVACLGSNVPGTQFTGPSGWVQAAQVGNTLSRSEIWYYPSCPAGVTSAVFTCGTGQVRAAMGEFHSSVSGDTFAVDVSGTAAPGAGTTCTASTSGAAAAGDLNVAAFFEHLPASTAVTWTDPSGFTLLGSITAANFNPVYSAYKLSATGGTVNVTATSSATSGANGWTGAVVCFKEAAATALTVTTTSLPGATVSLPYEAALAASGGSPPYSWSVSVGSLPAGLSLAASGGRGGLSGCTMAASQKPSPSIATANWQALTGINCTARKCYFQTNPDGSGIFPTVPDNTIQDCIDNGLVLYLCVKPALNPPTVKDYNALQTSVAAMVGTYGLTVKVIFWQEVELQVSNPTLYKAALAYYAGAVHATGGALLVHDASGSAPAKWASYFPDAASGSLAVVDEYGVDFYGNTYARGVRIGPYMAMAAATGKRVGVLEMGTSIGNAPPPPATGPGSVTEYLNYLNGFAASLPPGGYLWYEQDNKNINNAITDPADFRIPLLQQINATIAGTGTGAGTITGTPTAAGTSSFTVKATDTAAATATAALSITVTAATGAPVVTTTSLPAATTGVAYTPTSLAESGGTAPFTWAVTTGSLPAGLSLSPQGLISGTATANAATSGFTVTVTDANSLTGTGALFITVVTGSPPPVPAPNPLGFPQVIIEAGLAAAAPQVPAGTFLLDDPVYGKLDSGNMLGDSTTWTDIAGLFRSGTVSRPSTRVQGPLITYQGGTATGTFDNTTGVLDPDNPSSPYAGALRPMVPFRVRAVYGSVSYPMWAGFTGSWAGADLTYDMGYDEVTITADDGFKILAGITIPGTGGSGSGTGDGDGEDSGARVTRILNAAAWYTDHRRVSVGDSPLQGILWGDTALNLLQLTADSEIGELYMDGAGFVVFRHRQAILEDTRSSQVQAVFGDLPGTVHGAFTELACIPHRRATDDTTLANDIQATSVGGTLQEAQSLTSQRKYLFPRTYARSDLLLTDDPTTLEWAQWVLTVSLDGDDRFDAITIDPLADPANLFPQVLAREIGDRIQVWRRPQNSGTTLTQDCFIRGIQHDLDAVNGTWSTTWTLQSASRYTGFLILDDPVNGLLDTGKLAF